MTRNKPPLVVAYGLGVDSAALLLELHRRKDRPDLILFADTGNERQETYDYMLVMQTWLKSVGFPPVTVVRNVVGDFKNWPPYKTLGENCLTNGTLPSLAFGFKSCSLKWKVVPQNRYCKTWKPAKKAWAAGQKVRKMFGYDNSPRDQKRYAQAVGVEDPLYDYEYPLLEWGWDRDEAIAQIQNRGLPGWEDGRGLRWVRKNGVPVKSACYFCPATQPEELANFKAIYLRYVVIMEARAKPRLEGHISQDVLDRIYLTETLPAWQVKVDEAVRRGKVPPKKPRKPCNATGVLGLWRRGVKGNRGGKYRPGMMTDLIREQGLLPAAEIDYLIQNAPHEILHNQQAFATGLEIPEWHDFIEAFTPEDGVDEIPLPKLEV